MTPNGLRDTASVPAGGLVVWLDQRAAIHPDREALIDGDRRISYGTLADRVHRLAAALVHEYGVRPGDRVAVLTVNRLEWVDLFFATAQIGAMLVPLNWRLTRDELMYQLTDCRSRLLFVSPNLEGLAKSLRFDGHIVLFGEHFERQLNRPPIGQQTVPFDAPHLILYTSGTTGRPKGAVLTQANTFWNCLNVAQAFGLSERDTTLTTLPMFHAGGVGLMLLPSLYCGARTILIPAFDAALITETVRREQVTTFFGVPAMWLDFLKVSRFNSAYLPSLRVIGSGGAPCPVAVIEQLAERKFTFRQGYGLTETSPGATLMPPVVGHDGSVGKPMIHVEMRIVDDAGSAVADGAMGEVQFRGPNVFAGYWGMPEATAETFTADGWLRTGDLGRLDTDGYLTLIDRKKDLIISGGENVAAAEVEDVLYRHPAISEAAVIGQPHEHWGESVLAVVVLRPAESLNADDVIGFCRQRLASFKTPRSVIFVDVLPRNAAGKVLKRELRDRFSGFAAERGMATSGRAPDLKAQEE